MADVKKIKVSEEEAVRVDPEKLIDFVARCYSKVGVDPQDAREAAALSVGTDLWGVDTHGVSNAPRNVYVPQMQRGETNPRPKITVVKETANTALLDGDNGFGYIVARRAMNLAIEKAKAHSVGLVTVRNSRHFGAAGCYSMMALEHDMIGIAMTNAAAQVVPTFGREPRFGTNPIAVAVPADRERYWALDMATSTVAANKLTLATRLGLPIPLGWAADREGNPITDPSGARESRMLLPLGGTPEASSYKGYGLAVWVDIMCGVLSGNGAGLGLIRPNAGHFFGAIDIAAFVEPAEFKAIMDRMLEDLRTTPSSPGQDRVFYAGLIERETEVERRARGVPLHRSVIAEFRQMADELGVTYDLSE